MNKLFLAGCVIVKKKSFTSIVQENLCYIKWQQLPELIGTMKF